MAKRSIHKYGHISTSLLAKGRSLHGVEILCNPAQTKQTKFWCVRVGRSWTRHTIQRGLELEDLVDELPLLLLLDPPLRIGHVPVHPQLARQPHRLSVWDRFATFTKSIPFFKRKNDFRSFLSYIFPPQLLRRVVLLHCMCSAQRNHGPFNRSLCCYHGVQC